MSAATDPGPVPDHDPAEVRPTLGEHLDELVRQAQLAQDGIFLRSVGDLVVWPAGLIDLEVDVRALARLTASLAVAARLLAHKLKEQQTALADLAPRLGVPCPDCDGLGVHDQGDPDDPRPCRACDSLGVVRAR